MQTLAQMLSAVGSAVRARNASSGARVRRLSLVRLWHWALPLIGRLASECVGKRTYNELQNGTAKCDVCSGVFAVLQHSARIR